MKTKRPFTYHIGNLLIVVSVLSLVLLFGFTYAPLFLPTPKAEKITSKKGFFVTIPKINAQAPVIPNVDPWNKAIYNKELKKGVAHAKGTALPDGNGTIFLFAHSSLPPWEMTRVNTAFLKLGQLENGDQIQLLKDGKEYIYKVRDKKEVWPTEVQYLTQLEKDQLILQTCVPIGTALRRLLVFADPIN